MSYKRTLLISENVLKENSAISSNVDMAVLTPTIRLVQDMKLQPITGTQLYREIQKQVYNDNLENRMKTLLDEFIEPILIHGVVAEAVYDLTYRFGNLTVAKNDGDNEKNPSIDELNYISERNTNRMQFYLRRLTDYLIEYTTEYPEFNDNTKDDIVATREPYHGNIFTGRNYDDLRDKLPAPFRYVNEDT